MTQADTRMNQRKKFKTYPHQYKIKINRTPSRGKDFIQIDKTVFAQAYQKMSRAPGALALYVWLVGNKDGYPLDFSPAAVLKQLGMPISTTHGAVARLKKEGFLVKRENSATHDFFEIAREDLVPKEIEEEMEDEECDDPSPVFRAKPGEFTF